MRWTAIAVGASAVFCAGTASAELHVSASPILGSSTPADGNWVECAVRIDNDGTQPARGQIELVSTAGYGKDDALTVRAPYAVAAGAAVTVRLPTRTFQAGSGPLDLRVLGEDGALLQETSVPASGSTSPFLIDASEPPRLAGALRDVPITVLFDPTTGSLPRSHMSGKVPISTGSLRLDAATGDPVMPERAAGYASATLVVMRSDQLSRMTGMALDALANHILTGGSLAVAVARPEDLRNQTLVALLGGEISPGPAPRQLSRTPADTLDPPTERDPSSGGTRRRPSARRVFPGEDVDNGLSGYSGGNLRPTLYGAAASYGLGEVHILAFDPTQAPGVDDPWVKSRMADLLQHAWDRRRLITTPHGAAFADEYRMRNVFKVLDPNQSSRWAIIVAAVLLTAYSVIAGPVNFSRAAKRGKPLRALWFLPIVSLAVFLGVVLLGIAAKGWTGKARHLTMIEGAPGMSKAGACRYRGYFTSRSRNLSVRATDLSSVLDTALEPRAGAARSLQVDRDGVQLVDLSTMPWETLVIREDGFASLGAGVSVLRGPNGDITVTNRMARDLRAAVLITPAAVPGGPRNAFYFERIADGEKKAASEGKSVSFAPWRTGSTRLDESDMVPIRSELERESSGLVAAWAALGQVSGRNVDWWPEDVPILLAQVDGGEGVTSDSGLRLDMDRVLIRLVGYGGVP